MFVVHVSTVYMLVCLFICVCMCMCVNMCAFTHMGHIYCVYSFVGGYVRMCSMLGTQREG